MSKQLYRYNNSIVALSSEEVLKAFSEAEVKTRTNQFSVIPSGISSKIREDIKKHWSEELRNWLKEKAKLLAGSNPINATIVRQALEEVLQESVRKRVKDRVGKNLAWAINHEMRYFASDFALSLLLQEAPNPNPTSLYRKRGNITFCTKTSDRTGQLVVAQDESQKADVYLFGIFNEPTNNVWLLGWAGRKDVEAASHGDKNIDSTKFPWRKPSYYIEFSNLRPMGALLKHLKIKEVPEGLFEQVPDISSVPCATKLPSWDSGPDPTDFDAIIFGKKIQTVETQEPARKETDQDHLDF